MKRKRAVVTFFAAVVIIVAFLGITNRAIHAQNAGSADSSLISKLDTVLNNQRLILDELGQIKEELRVIKIRVTQSQ